MLIKTSQIVSAGINVINIVQNSIFNLLRDRAIFESVEVLRTGKIALEIDLVAERLCQSILYRTFGNKIKEVYGEEKIANQNIDLSDEQGLIALIDMVDGTDLLKRGLSNWCSAIIFYYPSRQQILGAFVGMPLDGIYYAVDGEKRAYKRLYKYDMKGNKLITKGTQTVALQGTSQIKELKKASVCFYGQKIERLLAISGNKRFSSYLKKLVKEADLETRIFNFAGNPMMIKLADGYIDAVFDLKGQYPHDFAPGAYIAKKAGAVLGGLKNQKFDLERYLLRPTQRGSGYILASTKKLLNEIQTAID